MFDINTIISTAIAEAVKSHLTEVAQHYANKMGEMATRIAELEAYKAAIGTDTLLAARIATLETEMLVLGNVDEIKYRIATLEDGKGMSEERVEALIETAIEQHCADYDHDSYDQVVSTVEDADLDDIVAKDDVEDMVRNAVNDAEITIRIR